MGNLDFDIQLADKIETLNSKQTKEEQLKIIYQWIKSNHIKQKEFLFLLDKIIQNYN